MNLINKIITPAPLSRAKRGCTVVSLLMLSAKIKKLI